MPPPPPRFSITTLCFNAADSGSASSRAQISAAPPAANDTTMRTGLLGQSAARAGIANNAAAISKPALNARHFISALPGRLHRWRHSHRLRGLGDTLPRALGDGNAVLLAFGADGIAALAGQHDL